jgi:hypothetical protein
MTPFLAMGQGGDFLPYLQKQVPQHIHIFSILYCYISMLTVYLKSIITLHCLENKRYPVLKKLCILKKYFVKNSLLFFFLLKTMTI